jgi:hypothetical protein
LLLAGCSKDIQNKDAVRQGVVDYLSKKGFNLNQMEVEIKQVNFQQDKAQAMVAFKPKGGQAADGMSLSYQLEKKGNKWEVVKAAPGGGANPHGGEMAPPMGMPPAGGGAMPPNHPPAPEKK